MSQLHPYHHALKRVAVQIVDTVETFVHLLLGTESLYYAQSAERLLHLAHSVTPQGLHVERLRLELAAHHSHEPSHGGNHGKSEERQLPTDEEQRNNIAHNEDRILEKHVERRHYRCLHLVHVAGDARYDVTLAFVGEETQRQRRYLEVYQIAYVADYSRTYGHDKCRGTEIQARLYQCCENEEQPDGKQCRHRSPAVYHLTNVIVQVAGGPVFQTPVAPSHRACHPVLVYLEKYLQYGYQCRKRKNVHDRRQYVAHYRQYQIFSIRRQKTPHYIQKVFYHFKRS